MFSRCGLASHPLSGGLPCRPSRPIPGIAEWLHDPGLGSARMGRARLLPDAGLDTVAVPGAAGAHRAVRGQVTLILERVSI